MPDIIVDPVVLAEQMGDKSVDLLLKACDFTIINVLYPARMFAYLIACIPI